jgi:hypothetical protein
MVSTGFVQTRQLEVTARFGGRRNAKYSFLMFASMREEVSTMRARISATCRSLS